MRARSAMRCLPVFMVMAACLSGGSAFGACRLDELVELPVTMMGLRPTIAVKVNGIDAVFAVDSGAFFGIIAPAAAKQWHLPLGDAPPGLRIGGIGGLMSYSVARVAHFGLGPVDLRDMDFVVGGNELGDGLQGLLGENVLGNADVEYDLANGAIRLLRPQGCGSAALAYWDKDKSFSMVTTARGSPLSAPLSSAYLNGRRIRVMFDTGSPLSLLSLRAAERAGVRPTDPGVVPRGYSYGVGQAALPTWIAPFDSFKLGQEEIRHTHLRIADLGDSEVDMYIGADFFLAHHIYVANSQHRVYFTYNSGPVFNLAALPPGVPRQTPPRAVAGAPASPVGVAAPGEAGNVPGGTGADAPGFARRGAADAARGDYTRAIAELTHALELDPSNPSYVEQRGLVERRIGQAAQALGDFNQALRLDPDDVPALMNRAQLRLGAADRAGASVDVLALDRILPKQADMRLELAALEMTLQQYPAAIQEYGLWLDAHRGDIAQAMALNNRCWARALADQELRPALDDCNAAIRSSATPAVRAAVLNSRGMVRLRLGDFAGSIKDYNGALSIAPGRALSLYGRGIDEIRQGNRATGEADLQAAIALRRDVAGVFHQAGIDP